MSLFNNNQQTQPAQGQPTTMFGGGNQGGGLFGAKPANGTQPSGLFGTQPAANPNPNPPQQGLFGVSNQPAQGGIGNNPIGGGGLFGANPPNPAQQHNTPMFGGGSAAPNLFGNQNKPQPATGGGLFSNMPQTQAGGAQTQPQQPQPQTNPLFGNNTGAGGGGLFGNQNQAKPQQEESKTPTMSFGNPNPPNPNPPNPNPLFSQPQPQPTQTQAGGLFSATQGQSGGLFAAPQGNNGNKPPAATGGLFNPPAQTQQPQANPIINNPPAQPTNSLTQPQAPAQNKPLVSLTQNTNPPAVQLNPPNQPQTQPQINNAMGPNPNIGGAAGGGLFANNNQISTGIFAKTDQSAPSQDQNKPSQANINQPQLNIINAGGQKPLDLKDLGTDSKASPIHTVSTPHLNTQPNLPVPGPNVEKERKPEEKPPGLQIGTQDGKERPQPQIQIPQNVGGGQQMIGNDQKKDSNQKYPTLDALKSKEKEQPKGAEYGQKGPYLTENIILKSCEQNNQFLLSILKNETGGSHDIVAILESRHIYEKLEKVMGYYKPSEEDMHFKKFYDEGKIKWNGKADLNNISKEFISLISEQSNIGIRHSFNLLDYYFRSDPRSFHTLINYQDSMPPELKAQLSRLAERVSQKIKTQISKERIRLLQIIYRLLSLTFLPMVDHPEKEGITRFMTQFLQKNNYMQILWGNFSMLCSSPIPDNLPSYEEMNLWVENTLHEEYMLLKCIFLLCKFQTISPELNYTMLETFYNQNFQGSFQSHNNQKNLKIQEFYQNQLKLAQNITDICVLILLANMSLDSIHGNISSKDIDQNVSPFNLIFKSGGKLFSFFQNAKELQEISVVYIAFRSLVLLFNQLAKNTSDIPKYLYEHDLNRLLKYEKVGYLGYVRDMFHHEIFKEASDYYVGLEYRTIIKNWISLMGVTLTESDLLQNYELYVDILYLCLNEPVMVTEYWENDVKNKTDLVEFVNKMMTFFPLKSAKFIKLLSAIVTKNKYSAGNIVKLLGEMTTFCSETQEIEYETVFSSVNDGHSGETFRSMEDWAVNDFHIPKWTQYRVISKTIENDEIPFVFLWSIEYNYWNRIFSEWTTTINKLSETILENIDNNLVASIKLICKVLTSDPKILYMLENYLTQRKIKTNGIYPAGITLILLLVDSWFYFQRLKNPPFSLFTHIISALNALVASEEREFKKLVCFVIQLHPHTVFNYEKNRPFEIIEHPFFEIVSLIKRNDNSIEFVSKKYDLLIEILNFCHQIFKNNEYPLDLFPDENQLKISYYYIPANFELRIQEIASKIQELHQKNCGWSLEEVDHINRSIDNILVFPIKSTFLDDLLKTVYQYILPNYDRFIFLPNELGKKFQIGDYIFKITRLLLSKFSVNLERVNIYFTQNIENPLLKLIVRQLNVANVQEFILKTLEVHATFDGNEERESASCLENKNWTIYIQNSQNDLDFLVRSAFRNMLASCLSCLETILTLAEIYNENKTLTAELATSNQAETSNLELIDFFYKVFSSKEEMFCYQQTYYTNNSSKQISINLILAISSLLNFENFKDLKVSNDTLSQIQWIFPANESEFENNQSFLLNADFSLGQNILLNGKVKTNLYQDSLTTLSLRIMSKLIVFWESLPSNKLLLNEFLISISLQSETGVSFNNIVYREMIKILFNHGEQTDDAIAVLELLLISLHSQKNFLDPFLKDTTLLSNLSSKINEKFLDFCQKVVREKEPKKLNKQFLAHFLLLICEIFKKEDTCRTFVSKLRNNMSFFSDLTNTIFTSFTPDPSCLKSVSDIISSNANIPVDQQIKNPQSQFNRLKMEYDILNVLSNNYMILTVLQFICNEILRQPKNAGIVLCQSFNKQFFNWTTIYSFNKSKKLRTSFKTGLDYFLNELNNVRNLIAAGKNEMNSYRSIFLKTVQPRQRIAQRESGSGILQKGLYKILNTNEFGYGKNFLFDSQELFFGLKLCNYKNDFIYHFTLEMQSYNLFNSIMDVEFKCLEGWVRLFSFISSLGEEGVAFSSMIYDTPVPGSQKLMQELFKNPKEMLNFNPNSGFMMDRGGFVSVFSENNAEPEERSWKFLKNVVKYVMTEFSNERYDFSRDDLYRRYLNQHINILISSFSCLHYLANKKNLEKLGKNFPWDHKDQTLSFAQNILSSMLQYPQLTEINITNFVTFLFNYLSFTETYEQGQEEPQVNRVLCESLFELLKRNLDCYALVVYCLIILTRRNPAAYIQFYCKDGRRMVEHILEKLSHQDTTYQEWISNIKFLIEICQMEKGCILLKDLGFINEICQNPMFKQQIDEYKDDNRNIYHIIWCWVLVLYRVFVKGLIRSPGDMNSALIFVKIYIHKIERVLGIPLILSSKEFKNSKMFSENIKIAGTNFRYSLAFLEELDYTLQLLSIFFLESKQWKEINKSQFDEVVAYLSFCTIKLFKSNFSYTENFIPQATHEKKLNEMFGSEKNLPADARPLRGIQPNDVVTSTATPMKSEINRGKDLGIKQLTSKEIVSTLTQYYNPSLYIFKIEICYQNILMSLMFILTQAFPYSDLCEYFDEQVYRNDYSNNAKHPKYENYYWEFFAEAVNDCQIYKRQTAQKWIAHEEGLKRSLRKLEVVRNSVETGVRYGSLNTLEKVPDFDLLIKYSINALIMSFEVAALHLEMFLEYKKLWNVLISDIIKDYKERTTNNIEESEKLLLKYIAKYEEIPNFSIMNFSVEGSVERRGLIESKSEMSENQKRISFMTCIKYHIRNLKI